MFSLILACNREPWKKNGGHREKPGPRPLTDYLLTCIHFPDCTGDEIWIAINES